MKHITWKKMTALTLSAALSLSLLAGCGGKQGETTESQSPAGQPAESQAAPADTDYDQMTIEELKPLLETVNPG